MDLPPWGFGPPPGGLEMLFGGPPSPGGDDDDEMPVDVEQLLASILPRSFGGIEAFAQAQGMRRARPADRKRLDHLLDEHAYSEPQPDEVVEEAVVTTTRAGRSRLAKRKFDLEDVKDKINCPICIETRDPGCDCLRMPCCGQRFHRACAIKWLTKESDKCPTCRAPLQDAPKKKKRDYAKLPIAELRKRCEERDVPTKGVVEKKELVALLKDEAERDDERRKRLPPPGAVPIFVGAVPPPPPGAARAFADAAREAGLPPFLFGAGSPFGGPSGQGTPRRAPAAPRRRGRDAAPAPAPARRRGGASPRGRGAAAPRGRATGGPRSPASPGGRSAPRPMMGFPPGPFFSTGGAGEPPAFLRALFDGVRRNVRDANRGGARQAPPLGFPGGMLPFQVVIGGGGPANLPPFPGAPGGIAMEDDDFVDVPSPREPPARRRRTS